MRLMLLFVLMTAAGPALAARGCPQLIDEHLRHARDPALLLMDLAQLRRRAAFVGEHADRVFLDEEDPWRLSASFALGTRMILGGQGCEDARRAEAQPGLAHLSLAARAEHRLWGVRLGISSTGRMDSTLVMETSPGEEQHQVGYLRGLLGVELQITEWFSVAFSQIGANTIEADDPYWRDAAPLNANVAPDYLLEVGIPKLGLGAQLTRDGGASAVRELALRDAPIYGRFFGSLVGRALPAEDAWLVAPKLSYGHYRASNAGLDFALEVGLAREDGDLRHVRVSAEHLLVSSRLKRRSYSKIGVQLEQRGAISMHRGALMRELSGSPVAMGVEWDMLMGMQTPHVYFFVNFGLGFNQPEMLDVLPVAHNRGMLQMGMHVETRW